MVLYFGYLVLYVRVRYRITKSTQYILYITVASVQVHTSTVIFKIVLLLL